jgi:hypothetical protein
MSSVSKGRRLSRPELNDGCEVIVECISRNSWPTDVRAIVEGDGVFRFTDPDGGFENSIVAAHWEGDTLVHPDGNRFVFYELMRGEA